MRILHIVPTYAPAWRYGGPIRSVHELCRSLARLGHDVHVYTTNVDGPGVLDIPTHVPIDRDGVKVWYFPVEIRAISYSASMAAKFKASIADFDMVHLHSIFLWPTMAAAREAERRRVPYLVAPRGMLVRDLFARKQPIIKWLWYYLFEKRTLARASAIHATSDLEVGEACRFKLPWPRFAVIANGVTIQSYESMSEEPGSVPKVIGSGRYVLFIGRISWKKGLDRLVKAMVQVSADVRLVIAGNDDRGYREKVETLIENLGLTRRVVFTGAVDGSAKAELITNASVLALPSYSENFGNVVLEAMAGGCPVVVTPEVGLAKVVNETKAGLVTDGEPSVLAAALMTIIDNRGLANEMGSRGRQAVAQEYNWDAIAKKVEALYRSLSSTRENVLQSVQAVTAAHEGISP